MLFSTSFRDLCWKTDGKTEPLPLEGRTGYSHLCILSFFLAHHVLSSLSDLTWSYLFRPMVIHSHHNIHCNILTSTLKPLMTGGRQLPQSSLHLWRLRTGSPWCVVITSCIAPCRVNTKRHAWPVPTQILLKGPSSPSSPLHSHVRPRPPERLQNNVLWVARNESRAKYLEILQILSHAHSIPVELWDIRKAMNGINGFGWFYHDFHMEMVEICGNGKSQIQHFLQLPGSQESKNTSFLHKKRLQVVWNLSRRADIKQRSQGAIPVCPQRNGSRKIVNRDPRSRQLKQT